MAAASHGTVVVPWVFCRVKQRSPPLFWNFAGQGVAKVDPYGAVHYFFADHLGSDRVMTNATGVTEQESDYYPFGGERVITDTLNDPNTRYWKENRFKFAGMWRDWESSNDHTMFRQYPSNLGRWLRRDRAGAYVVLR